MIAAFILAAATVDAGVDRLALGSLWHCDPVGLDDRYSVDFVIERGRAENPGKKLRIVTASGGAPIVSGFGFDHGEKNNVFDSKEAARNESYPYAEFTQGFYNRGVSISVMWRGDRPALDLTIHTFDYEHRLDPAKRDEKIYGLSCVPSNADGSGSRS